MVKSIFGYRCLSSEGVPWMVGDNWALCQIDDTVYEHYRIYGNGDEVRAWMTKSEAKRFLSTRPTIPTLAEQREHNQQLHLIHSEY